MGEGGGEGCQEHKNQLQCLHTIGFTGASTILNILNFNIN